MTSIRVTDTLGSNLRSPVSPYHNRSSSFKNRPKPKLALDTTDKQRQRTNSLPTSQLLLPLPHPDWMSHCSPSTTTTSTGLCRVRSFITTSKGIVNRGDSFKRSTHSLASKGSVGNEDYFAWSQNQGDDYNRNVSNQPSQLTSISGVTSATTQLTSDLQNEIGFVDCSRSTGKNASPTHASSGSTYHTVLMMGATGSGKTALTRQFMTSEYKGTYEIGTPDVEEDLMTVSVLLDGDESTLCFIDEEIHPDVEHDDITVDAYVVVFSVIDPGSFKYAISTVRRLRMEARTSHAIVLVGNKIDLVRQRRITKHDIFKVTKKYGCHYAETSAALNHHIDELLVCILSQIRVKTCYYSGNGITLLNSKGGCSKTKSPVRSAICFFRRLFGYGGSRNRNTTVLT